MQGYKSAAILNTTAGVEIYITILRNILSLLSKAECSPSIFQACHVYVLNYRETLEYVAQRLVFGNKSNTH